MKRIRSAHPTPVQPAPLKVQGAPPQVGAGQSYTVEYYYKLPWGRQQEFLQLFLKNHYPLLEKIRGTGRILSLKMETPAYHTTEDGRWDYRVTIRYKDSTVATTANPEEARFQERAMAGPGGLRERRAAEVRDSAGSLGPSGDGDYSGEVASPPGYLERQHPSQPLLHIRAEHLPRLQNSLPAARAPPSL